MNILFIVYIGLINYEIIINFNLIIFIVYISIEIHFKFKIIKFQTLDTNQYNFTKSVNIVLLLTNSTVSKQKPINWIYEKTKENLNDIRKLSIKTISFTVGSRVERHWTIHRSTHGHVRKETRRVVHFRRICTPMD